MPKPITPMVGCEAFVVNDANEVLLVKRSDDGTWCLPGGCQDLGETPAACARREFFEESGYEIEIQALLGVFSSLNYEYVHYLWKENEFVHILFQGKIVGGHATTSSETSAVDWFPLNRLPQLLDGHENRIRLAYQMLSERHPKPHFE